MHTPITQAMILAAGKGTRMQPLTLTTPKPLIAVHDKPLIVWHIERLVQAGITHIVINAGYLADKLVAFFETHDFGVNIRLSIEQGEPLETAGGIKLALANGLLADEPFLLLNGDIWTDTPLIPLCRHHLGSHLGHLYLVDNPNHNPLGDFMLNQNLVAPKDNSTQTLTFAGLSVLSPRLFDHVPVGKIMPLAPILKQAITQGQITGTKLSSVHWVDVGTIERLQQLEQFLSKNKPL